MIIARLAGWLAGMDDCHARTDDVSRLDGRLCDNCVPSWPAVGWSSSSAWLTECYWRWVHIEQPCWQIATGGGVASVLYLPSVLFTGCWMGVRKSIRPVKIRAGFSLSRALFSKKCGASLIYEYRQTEFTRHAQWQCCHHQHFVKDSHNTIICTRNRRCGVTGV